MIDRTLRVPLILPHRLREGRQPLAHTVLIDRLTRPKLDFWPPTAVLEPQHSILGPHFGLLDRSWASSLPSCKPHINF